MQDVQIKAIPTKFDGYQFRSRTEARWAVFFKETGTKYIYEEEGFELPFGRYLPDFHLTDYDAYIEIKGMAPADDEERKCWELCEHTGKPVFLISGIPGSSETQYFHKCLGGVFWDTESMVECHFNKNLLAVTLPMIIKKAKQYKFGRIA